MSVFEFQLSSAAFLLMQRNALRALRICRPTPINVGGVDLVLDRIEFGNNALQHNVDTTYTHDYTYFSEIRPFADKGHLTQVTQDVTVHVATWQAVQAAPNQAPTTTPFSLRLHFTLDFFSREEDDCVLVTQLERVEPLGLPPLPPGFGIAVEQVMAYVATQIRTSMPAKSVPIDLGSALPSGMHVCNAGMSVDEAGAIVAFRLQLSPPPSYGSPVWENFHSGFIFDRLEGKDFGFYIEAEFINESVKTQINQALAGIDVDDLDTYVGCHYSNAGGQAQFTVDVLAIYDLPDPLGTYDVDPKIPVHISVPAPNVVEVDANFTSIAVLVGQFLALIGWFLPGLVNPLEAMLQAEVGSAIASLNDDGELGVVTATPDFHVIARRRVRVPSPLTGTVATLTTLIAQEHGISFAGTLRTNDLDYAQLSTTRRELEIRAPDINCGAAGMSVVAAFRSDPTGFPVIRGSAMIIEDGTVPTYLCDVRVLNDPLGVFPRASIRVVGDETPIALAFDFQAPPDAYYANPYSCEVLVVTTGGTRLIRLAPPPRFTGEDAERLAADLLVELGNCLQLVAPWYRYYHGYNPRWSVDPTPELDVERVWQIEITGMQPGEFAAVVTDAGVVLARAQALEGTAVRMTVLTDASQASPLTIQRIGSTAPQPMQVRRGGGGQADTDRGIAVGQQNLHHVADVTLPRSCLQLVRSGSRSDRAVYVIAAEAVMRLDLDSPSRPVIDATWRLPSVRGAVGWRGDLLVFGDEGFATIRDGRLSELWNGGCSADPVRSAAGGHRVLYALREDRLDVLRTDADSSCLELHRSKRMSAPRSLVRIRDVLVVAEGDRLIRFDLTDPLRPRRGTTLDVFAPATLGRAPGLTADSFLASYADGSASVITLAGDAMVESSRYSSRPWFAESVNLRDVLVRPGPDARSLQVFRFGAAAAV